MKTLLVIPHHLPTLDFLNEWKTELEDSNVDIIIVEDKAKRVTTVPEWLNSNGRICLIYTHEDIDKELGKNSWIIPRGTSAIRSFGLWKAWQLKPDMIVTLDNDCFPNKPGYIGDHWEKLELPATLDWVRSSPNHYWLRQPSRGFPYGIRDKSKVYINHGVWSNIPDLDAAQMLLYPTLRTTITGSEDSVVIPRWNFYPMCGMNLAFRPETTPLMYFGLFGKKYGFDQFDDIWAGVFSKKIMDHLGWAVRSGHPSVEHRKQSNAFVNFRKQAGGLEWNEKLWRDVQKANILADNPIECYRELLDILSQDSDLFEEPYFKKVAKATNIWLSLFEK